MVWYFPNVIKLFICFFKRECQEQIPWFGVYLALFHVIKWGNILWFFWQKIGNLAIQFSAGKLPVSWSRHVTVLLSVTLVYCQKYTILLTSLGNISVHIVVFYTEEEKSLILTLMESALRNISITALINLIFSAFFILQASSRNLIPLSESKWGI